MGLCGALGGVLCPFKGYERLTFDRWTKFE